MKTNASFFVISAKATKPLIQQSIYPSLLLAALVLLAARTVLAEQYHGNGDTSFGGAIGNGTLTLSDDGNNRLVYMGSVNLTPLNNTGPYTFRFPAALIGMIPGVRSTSDTWSYYPYALAVRIFLSGPTSAVVAWPVWSPTPRLRQTTDLSTGPWATVSNAVTRVGSENHVTVSPLSHKQFFRVEYP